MKNIKRERSNHLIGLIECFALGETLHFNFFCLIMVFGVRLYYAFLLEDIASHFASP